MKTLDILINDTMDTVGFLQSATTGAAKAAENMRKNNLRTANALAKLGLDVEKSTESGARNLKRNAEFLLAKLG